VVSLATVGDCVSMRSIAAEALGFDRDSYALSVLSEAGSGRSVKAIVRDGLIGAEPAPDVGLPGDSRPESAVVPVRGALRRVDSLDCP
jgi:hypothetical protein